MCGRTDEQVTGIHVYRTLQRSQFNVSGPGVPLITNWWPWSYATYGLIPLVGGEVPFPSDVW